MRGWLVRGPGEDGGQASTLIAIATFVVALAIVIFVIDAVGDESPLTTFLSGDNWAANALGNGDADLPAPAESGDGAAANGLPALPQVGDGPIGAPTPTSPLLALALLGTMAALPVAARIATSTSPPARST